MVIGVLGPNSESLLPVVDGILVLLKENRQSG